MYGGHALLGLLTQQECTYALAAHIVPGRGMRTQGVMLLMAHLT